jgi:hypothetical protein
MKSRMWSSTCRVVEMRLGIALFVAVAASQAAAGDAPLAPQRRVIQVVVKITDWIVVGDLSNAPRQGAIAAAEKHLADVLACSLAPKAPLYYWSPCSEEQTPPGTAAAVFVANVDKTDSGAVVLSFESKLIPTARAASMKGSMPPWTLYDPLDEKHESSVDLFIVPFDEKIRSLAGADGSLDTRLRDGFLRYVPIAIGLKSVPDPDQGVALVIPIEWSALSGDTNLFHIKFDIPRNTQGDKDPADVYVAQSYRKHEQSNDLVATFVHECKVHSVSMQPYFHTSNDEPCNPRKHIADADEKKSIKDRIAKGDLKNAYVLYETR